MKLTQPLCLTISLVLTLRTSVMLSASGSMQLSWFILFKCLATKGTKRNRVHNPAPVCYSVTENMNHHSRQRLDIVFVFDVQFPKHAWEEENHAGSHGCFCLHQGTIRLFTARKLLFGLYSKHSGRSHLKWHPTLSGLWTELPFPKELSGRKQWLTAEYSGFKK